MTKQIITITEKAADRISKLLNARDKPSIGIRIGVKARGCAGMEYVYEYADEVYQNDICVTEHGIQILIDKAHQLYLIGTKLDYIETEIKSGFQFINPNEKGRCGCGESFYT